LVREVGHLGVKGANLDVRLLDDKFLLCEAFIGHKISVLAKLSLEFLSTCGSEHIKESENLRVLLGQLLDSSLLNKLIEVNDINSLDGEDNASSCVSLSCGKNSSTIISSVKLKVSEHHLESVARFTDSIECAANFLIETSTFFLGQVPGS